MCGIAGLMAYGDAPIPNRALRTMVARLAHRGPDDDGIWISSEGAIGLGATRLAITDPSPAGRQPMTCGNDRSALVFNGEIYNHAELRRALQWDGVVFRSRDSDTEVLLRALDRWGEDCLPRLRGMYAFAYWNTDRRSLLLARDPFGTKPLYYARDRQFLLFASEPGALLASQLVEAAPSAQGIADWLCFLAVPGSQTLYAGIRKLEAGSLLRCTLAGELRSRVHWDPASLIAARNNTSQAAALPRTRYLINQAMQRAAGADRIAVTISGGVDSELIAAALSGRAAPRSTFVTLDVDPPAPGSESRLAAETCRRLAIANEPLALDDDAFLHALAALEAVRPDIPVATPDMVLLHALGRHLRNRSLRICLIGEGADEIGGYPSYLSVPDEHASLRLLAALGESEKAALFAAADSAGRDRLDLVRSGAMFPARHIQAFRQWRRQQLWSGPEVACSYQRAEALVPGGTDANPDGQLDRITRLEFKLRMPDFLLARCDDAISACSIEARPVFLDLDLVEASLCLPRETMIAGGECKILFKKIFAESVGTAHAFKRKQGFGRVLARLLDRLAPRLLATETGSRTDHPLFAYLKPAGVRALLSEHRAGQLDAYQLWVVFALARWLNRCDAVGRNLAPIT